MPRKKRRRGGLVLGIDLGSAIRFAPCKEGVRSAVVTAFEGANPLQGIRFPSYVSFDQAGNVLHVGRQATDNWDQGSNPVVWGGRGLAEVGCDEARREERLPGRFTCESNFGGGTENWRRGS